MLSMEAMQQLREAYFEHTSISEETVLTQIGNPTPDDIIETALAGMKSENRNERVLMLRVLRKQSGEKAMRGILAGLHDKERRVRTVAIKSSRNYHEFPEITNRLKEIALDEQEKRKIRDAAIGSLVASEGHHVGDLTETAAETLEILSKMPKYRFQILFGLLRLDLNDPVETLLKEFVESGTKAEAIMATRALCGYRVIHITIFEHDKTAEQHIKQTCEVAFGRMFYWITRAEYDKLLKF